jgi:hypothetical protein
MTGKEWMQEHGYKLPEVKDLENQKLEIKFKDLFELITNVINSIQVDKQ